MEVNPLQSIYQDFVVLIENSIIKYSSKARVQETLEMTKSADQYIAARLGEDNFFSYMTYDKEFLIKLGITDPDTIQLYMDNRRNIPEEYHERLLLMKREQVINSYVERNDYYRCMLGLPNNDDTDVFYVDDAIAEIYQMDNSVPIHQMQLYHIIILEEIGYLKKLKEDNPDKEYLKYLGKNSIDLIISRRAKNFSLLRVPINVTEIMNSNFKLIYEQCREYFMSTIYVEEHTTIYEYYDNFIAMCIMVMTIQQIIARTCKSAIDREFFDEYCIRLLYENYNVPYIKELDLNSQRAIMQNLNILIQYKGTDKVLYDIASLLGYDRVKIYKYYLMKQQKYDDNDMPITKTKTIINDYGEPEVVPDYEAMFDVYFQKLELKEEDYHRGFQNLNDREEYMEITEFDPYWWEDNDLYNELYEDEYNFKETKYLSMNIAYRLTEVMFETVYLVRMLLDKKNELYGITLQLPKILGPSEVSLFNVVVALCAMVSKKNNLRGEVLYTPSKILHVLGFNFKHDFDVIRKHIRDNPFLDNAMLDYLEYMSAYTVESVNNLYLNIKGLRDFIVEKLSVSSNIHEYRAYQLLYKALYISEENKELFAVPNEEGELIYADTYLEYLKMAHKDLYDFIETSNKDELSPYVDHIIYRLSEIIPTIRFLYVSNDANNVVLDALLKLIRFFKSYTTDMIGLNVVYLFDTKALNMLKLIDGIALIQKEILVKDRIKLAFSDTVSNLILRIYQNDNLKFFEKISMFAKIQWADELKLRDDIKMEAIIEQNDSIQLYDYLEAFKILSVSESLLKFTDHAVILNNMYQQDKLTFNEVIAIKSLLNSKEYIRLYDELSIRNDISLIEPFIIKDFMADMISRIYASSKIKMEDTILDFEKIISSKQFISLYDTMNLSVRTKLNSSLKFRDSIKITYSE